MKLTKTMLEKLEKNELVDLVMQLQEQDQQKNISIYDKYKNKNLVLVDVASGDSGRKIWAKIADEYLIVIKSEYITPSGYPKSGTLNVLNEIELSEEDRDLIIKQGFTKETMKKIEERQQEQELTTYDYHPQTKEELIEIIKQEIYEVQGTPDNPNWKANLNYIDTSNIVDMRELFSENTGLEKFNGNISGWNVSNVEDMSYMFYKSQFNGDISKWDVSNIEDMTGMFTFSSFNQDISKWNVSKVIDMEKMFKDTPFNQDISKWNLSNVKYKEDMLTGTPLEKKLQEQEIKVNVNDEDIDNDEVEIGR